MIKSNQNMHSIRYTIIFESYVSLKSRKANTKYKQDLIIKNSKYKVDVMVLPNSFSCHNVRPLDITTSLTILASSRRPCSSSQRDIINHFQLRRHSNDIATSYTISTIFNISLPASFKPTKHIPQLNLFAAIHTFLIHIIPN